MKSSRSYQDGMLFEERISSADGYTPDANNHDPTNSNATPDYGSILGIGSWDCTKWMEWHKSLKKTFGTDQAKSIWNTAWENQRAGDSSYSFCKYQSDFANYAKSEGLNIHSWLLSNTVVGGNNIANNIIDTTTNATNTLKWLTPMIVIVVVIGLGIYGYKTFIKPSAA